VASSLKLHRQEAAGFMSTMVCSAVWSIGLSADDRAVEPGLEHAAIRRATPTSKLTSARMENLNIILLLITVAGVPQNIEDTFIRPNETKLSRGEPERVWLWVEGFSHLKAGSCDGWPSAGAHG